MSKSHYEPYFLNLKNLFCDTIHHCSYIKQYSYNETLYHQGDAPRNLYILLSGRLEVFKETTQIMDCIAGECIGAQANFANICYPETVKFFSPGEALVIRFDLFKEKIIQYPTLLKEIIESLTQKQKIVTNALDKKILSYLEKSA
ncbi:MAG: cyclic nucleotide-binding domain-containing protein [Sulfurospirillaceae bacterium]|nr:cyclic nucleotide-binding domain-containing protein [Sulfurospirillaceae bacterium]MDD2827740.1 cyclic nucleotide-binding domain-containing protein [Sulfurospirillaceae bacterium]